MLRDIHISIVSHGQQHLVIDLLNDIGSLTSSPRCQVSITHNIPEKELASFLDSPFPINVIKNSSPKGYGANHNNAFHSALLPDERRYFIVMNPDVRIQEDVFTLLTNAMESNSFSGVVAPFVYATDGLLEDSVRDLPTPLILARKLLGLKSSLVRVENQDIFNPDWIAGMFMLFPSDVFKKIGGFNERYFLYYEDVDICSRLWLAGYSVHLARDCSIIHDARRDSRRKVRYVFWHLSSIKRFLSSDVYKKVKNLHAKRHLRDE